MKNISIGFSPCPNDTFIFDAMINGRIDTGDYKFTAVLEDVEQLNRMASKGMLDVSKISLGAFAEVSKNYVILDSGSALGNGVGPLLVSKTEKVDLNNPALKVAIPGKFTTANLLLSIFFPQIKNKTEVLFSDIEQEVLSGNVDAGLLIHEGRFTYREKNLHKIFDLGDVWENHMHSPLPLGCICASRKMTESDISDINKMIRQSILFAMKNPEQSKSYTKQHSQEMADDVIEKHIALYVNEFSVALGPDGRKAIEFLLQKGFENGLLPRAVQPVFNRNLE